MRTMMFATMALVAGLITTQSSGSASADPCAGNFCNRTTVTKLFPIGNNDPRVHVRPTDGGLNALACTAVGQYLTLKASHPLFSEIYAALLDATIHNKDVTFRIVTGSPDCEISYIVLENP